MKRYYVSPILLVNIDGEESWVSKISLLGVAWAGSIPTVMDPNDPRYGQPMYDCHLVSVNAVDHLRLRDDQDLIALPDCPLDIKVMSINTATKNKMMADLTAKGFDVSHISTTEGYRETLQDIGRQRDPDFQIDRLDVA